MAYTVHKLFFIAQPCMYLSLDLPTCVLCVCVCVTSGAVAGGPEASNALRDDPRLMAAPYEAAALPQSLQGLLRPVRRSH